MKILNKGFVLIIILVLAAVLRLWNLPNVPPSASMDEASIGYNAYSVSKIGVDEYGDFPILSQRGYDDWRRSTYLFLVVPMVKLFGLNVVSVRLPAVILSILTVWATYHIVLYLFYKSSTLAKNIALLASFLLAISPWHIYISRLGHESNACLTFLVLGVLFFLQGLKNKKSSIIFSMIFFTLSMVSYYSGQAFIPLFIIGLFLIFKKQLLPLLSDKKMIITFLLFAILLIPILLAIFSPQSLIRFQGTSTFKPEAHYQEFAERVELHNKAAANNDFIGTVLYSRHFFPVQVFIEGYVSHFKPDWLFTNPSAESHKVPNIGLLYLWEVPFIIVGIIFLLLNRNVDVKIKKIIFLWFFLAPIPAAIATQTPHAMRSYNFLPTWQIFSALGLIYSFSKLQKFKVVGFLSFAILILFSLITFYKNYFIVFPEEQSSSFHYGLSKTIPYILSEESRYQTIVFSNKNNLYQSYMLFLFHSRYDALLYQKQGGTQSGGFAETHKFDKYEFRPINWEKEIENKEILYVGNPEDFPISVKPIKIFYNLDGTEAIKVVKK